MSTETLRELQADGNQAICRIIARIRRSWKDCPIPILAQSDWQGTNHYEIHDLGGADWWWLDVFDTPSDSGTESGKRLGAVLDYATYYRRDVETLLEIIDGEHECGQQDERKDQPHEAGRE